MIQIFKRVLISYFKKKDSVFSVEKSVQEEYLLNFNDPVDDIERSFYQYKCQGFLQYAFIQCVVNLIASFIVLPYLGFFVLNSFLKKNEEKKKFDAVLLTNNFGEEIVPNELKQKYEKRVKEDLNQYGFLLKKDFRFVLSIIKRYPFSPWFYFKIIFKIALYRRLINKYEPNAFITSTEYSYTSSVLTRFCEDNGIQQINIMHGEKLFYIRDSFCRFHKFYIWDNYYCELFMKLRANLTEYIVVKPEFNYTKSESSNTRHVDYKYYLGNENKETLELIQSLLLNLKNQNLNVKVRYHPRYSNHSMIMEIFNPEFIEHPNDIDICNSIVESNNVISLYSTVLFQAYLLQTNVVLDDFSDRQKFNKLKNLGYIMLSKSDRRISKLLDN